MTAAGYAIWTQAVRRALLPNTEAEARSCRNTKRRTYIQLDVATRLPSTKGLRAA